MKRSEFDDKVENLSQRLHFLAEDLPKNIIYVFMILEEDLASLRRIITKEGIEE